MKLKEKFEDITVMFQGQEGSLGYDELCNASNECVKIAEDFVITFVRWLDKKDFDGKTYEELLRIYKKENNL